MTDRVSVAIIGAGMAGLACATRLSEAGVDCLLFDKGRGPGGRMAARRVEIDGEVVSFDHGAQYFTARDPGFRKAVEAWHAMRVVERWPSAGEDAWVGTPGMNGPIRAMAQEQTVEWGMRVDRLARDGGDWSLVAGDRTHAARHVLIAVPAEQAAELLADVAPELAEIAGGVRSKPCWAVMAAFDQRLSIECDTIRNPDAAISWAARNSAKPGRAGHETWVLHASPNRSLEIIDCDKDEAASLLLADFFEQAAIEPCEPVHLTAHRWLYAMAEAVAGEPARYDTEKRIGIAGDYLHSPRVESAYVSGLALAERLLAAAR